MILCTIFQDMLTMESLDVHDESSNMLCKLFIAKIIKA